MIQFWSGFFPVDGVGRISYGHGFHHFLPHISIPCILHYQSIFLHFFFFLVFSMFVEVFPFLCNPAIQNAEPSIKHCSLLKTWPYHHILLAFSILSKDSSRPSITINSSVFLLPISFTPHIFWKPVNFELGANGRWWYRMIQNEQAHWQLVCSGRRTLWHFEFTRILKIIFQTKKLVTSYLLRICSAESK